MLEWLSNPLNTLLLGLGAGLLASAWLIVRGWLGQRGLRKEVAALKEHLHRQMTIVDRGNASVLKELDDLKRQNENLRVSVASLKAKPGRAELAALAVYEKALALIHRRAPGFGPAWQDALDEARKEVGQVDTGLLAFVRSALAPPRAATEAPDEEAAEPGEPA